MSWQAIGSALPALLSVAGSFLGEKKSAQDSSALQYAYQTKLNSQNYKYNLKLINTQNAFNEAMMDKANDWNYKVWNEAVDLTNNAHQREVADLKAAGLNPILAANGGASTVNPIQSAQTSSGNSQLSSSAGMPDIDYMSAVNTAANMYQQNRQVKNELENSRVGRSKMRAEESNIYNQIDINNRNSASEIRKRDAEIRAIDNQIANNTALTKAQIGKLASESALNYQNSARSHQETINSASEYQGRLSSDRAKADWIRKHPHLYNVGQVLQNVAPGMFGAAALGGVGVSSYNAYQSHKNPSFRGRRR